MGTDAGGLHVRKVLTTPDDPRVGGGQGRARRSWVTPGSPPADVARVVHGTTLATNVILERRGGRSPS